MTDQADKLVARRPDLEVLMKDWKVVDDVLAGGIALKNKTYLPQHGQELDDEYNRRLLITPVFPETPKSMQMLLGALFRVEPTVSLPPNLEYLKSQATLASVNTNGSTTLKDCFAKCAQLCVAQGFCGILEDRKALPADLQVTNGETSVADVNARGPNNVYKAIYSAEQILSWASDDNGLKWVKLVETNMVQDDWDSDARKIYTIRIVNRLTIRKFLVEEKDNEREIVQTDAPVPHGAKDANGNACVPFRFFHPFPAKDGIGRPILKPSAEADVAALWVLSETLWLAYLMAPLLCLKTGRPDSEIKNIGIGAGRFITLKVKDQEGEAEELSFTQLDPTAITQLRGIWEMLSEKARDAMAKGGSAENGPTEQSGISKAWTFKTNEERLLFLIGICLRDGFQWLLELSDRMTRGNQTDDSKVTVAMPESYDIASPKDSFEAATEAADWFARYDFNEAVIEAMRMAIKAIFPNLSEDAQAKFDERLEEMMEKSFKPERVFETDPSAPKPPPVEKPEEEVPAK